MCQALSGLKHMHDLKIAHRDLKPENLLLSSKEQNATVKIADFGFAVKVQSDVELDQLVGTPPYFAPELSALRDISVQEGYGRPVDVWAMGVILYILLSGIHPFQIQDEDLMLDNIQNAKWDWVGPNWTRISADAKDLITNMMHKDPAKRFTIDQCLTHRWMTVGMSATEDLAKVADAIKNMQAKKKLKGAMQAVLAQQRMKRLLGLRPAPAKKTFGKIIVKALQGRDLASKDSNGKSDPYLTINFGTQQAKTKVVKKTLNPVWQDPPIVFANDGSHNHILVECWDWDQPIFGSHDFMGEFVVLVSSIPDDGVPIKQFYDLSFCTSGEKRKKTKHVSGAIELEFCKSN